MALLNIVVDRDALAERVAERFTALAAEAVRARGMATICLAGGRTPSRTYELLATDAWQSRVAWESLHLYWTDERHVPPDHSDSNFGVARDLLVMRVPIPASHVHRIRGELPPDEAAKLYERELPDQFDVLLLGVGEDAHIASIFPGSPVISEPRQRVAGVWVPQLRAYRVTLTPPALLTSDHVIVMASGTAKADAVGAAFNQPTNVERYPAHLLRAAGDRVEWFIDRAAAQDVPSQRV